jgi:hypothetical protein
MTTPHGNGLQLEMPLSLRQDLASEASVYWDEFEAAIDAAVSP